MSEIELREDEHDEAYIVRGIVEDQPRTDPATFVRGPDNAPDLEVSEERVRLASTRGLDVFATQPKPVRIAALNGVAGKILEEQGIRAATTEQLLHAVSLAEERLGWTYADAVRPPEETETDRDKLITAALAKSGLTFETATAEQLISIATEVRA